ncbi:hypothetical protein MKW92_007895, partial [Papaver armeniacum]
NRVIKSDQRQYKVSFFVEKDKANLVIKALSERLENCGQLDIKIVFSGGEALDVFVISSSVLTQFFQHVLLKRGGKGEALAYLLKKFGHGKQPSNTLVCGDSGNDAELFGVPDVFGVMLELYKILVILNLSPRDILYFSKRSLEITNPGHEIYPSGVFVSPSGQEHPLHDYKQGKQFRVWVDRVTSAEIGSDTWSMKFDKWELSYDGPKGCTFTVLLSSKGSASDGFVWMHMHQTWLAGPEATDQTYLLFWIKVVHCFSSIFRFIIKVNFSVAHCGSVDDTAKNIFQFTPIIRLTSSILSES